MKKMFTIFFKKNPGEIPSLIADAVMCIKQESFRILLPGCKQKAP